VAELGTELGNGGATEQHFASWLGLSPKRDVSGGKVIRHTHEKNRNRVAGIFADGGHLAAAQRQLPGCGLPQSSGKLGSPKAIKANGALPGLHHLPASSPKARHGWIAESNSSSRTDKRAIWPNFSHRPVLSWIPPRAATDQVA